MSFFSQIRRKPDGNSTTDKGAASGATLPIRLSGTSPNQEYSIDKKPKDGQLGDANGRQGNDYYYPDHPRGAFRVGTTNGDRLQDFANTHLSEGPVVGRIPRQWNDRKSGKTGRGISGNPGGDNFFADTTSGESGGGIADMQYVPHTPTPRGITIARPYMRTIDDGASIPGVYVADATRR
jgi:hypothetical protein